jgi:hypothetical protein
MFGSIGEDDLWMDRCAILLFVNHAYDAAYETERGSGGEILREVCHNLLRSKSGLHLHLPFLRGGLWESPGETTLKIEDRLGHQLVKVAPPLASDRRVGDGSAAGTESQQSSDLKSLDAVQDDSMRWNNSADGVACFLRLAGPQVV